MIQQKITITNEVGMNARLSTWVFQTANRFKSEITFEANGKKADANSLLKFLSLGIRRGDELVVSADGPDEAEAVDAICSLIRQKADEEHAVKERWEKRRAEKKPGLLSRLIAMLCGRK